MSDKIDLISCNSVEEDDSEDDEIVLPPVPPTDVHHVDVNISSWVYILCYDEENVDEENNLYDHWIKHWILNY